MIGHWEMLAIIAVILLIFGPSKLPALGRSIGEGFRNLKKGLKGDGSEEEEKKAEENRGKITEGGKEAGDKKEA